MFYVGIDPGLAGGIAFIDDRHARHATIRAFRMPRNDRELLKIFRDIVDLASFDNDPVYAMLEHVWSSPDMGVASSFTFGKGFGKLEMALTAVDIPYELVAPVKWQRVMNVLTPKERRAELGHKDKNINKRAAEGMLARKGFANLTVTHAIADALLLAEYCRIVRGGRLFDTSAEGTTNGEEGQATRTSRPRRHSGRRPRTRQRDKAPAADPF